MIVLPNLDLTFALPFLPEHATDLDTLIVQDDMAFPTIVLIQTDAVSSIHPIPRGVEPAVQIDTRVNVVHDRLGPYPVTLPTLPRR